MGVLSAMRFSERALSHLSLVFGLVASGALSLAITTDFWLFMTENLDISTMSAGGEVGGMEGEVGKELEELMLAGDNDTDVIGAHSDVLELPMTVKLHAGLWRSCVYYDEQPGILIDQFSSQ